MALTVVASIVLIITGGLNIADYLRTTAIGEDHPIADETITYSIDRPSEKSSEAVSDDYVVPDNQPRLIKLPSIDVEGYIQRVGIDQNGAMAVPSNIHFVGWYIHGVAPGEKGLSIIAGHVNGRYSPGIFARLRELTPGTIFQIQMGDLSWREFRVFRIADYLVEDVTNELFKHDQTISFEIKLITCSGNFNSQYQTYDMRTIATAELVAN